MNINIKNKVILVILTTNVLLCSVDGSIAQSTSTNEWTTFSLKDSKIKFLDIFWLSADSEAIPIEIDLNITDIQNAELVVKTYQSTEKRLEMVNYAQIGNFTFSNSTTMLQFDLKIPGTDTWYYVDHNSSVSFKYRLKSTSTSLPADVELNAWKEVTLQSLGPSIQNIFESDTEHNVSVNIQLNKIENASFNLVFFKSDYGKGEPINDFKYHSVNAVGHVVNLEIDAINITGVIEGQYQLTDYGSVGPIIPGFEFPTIITLVPIVFILKKKKIF